MRSSRTLITVGLLLVSLPSFASIKPLTSHRHTHATLRHSSTHGRKTSHIAAHHEMAEAMPSERATQIQSALIRQGYLTGEPSGTWDAQTIAAMQKLQSDNGWQSRITPDSRALIKLGLGGPDQASASAPSLTSGSSDR